MNLNEIISILFEVHSSVVAFLVFSHVIILFSSTLTANLHQLTYNACGKAKMGVQRRNCCGLLAAASSS